MADYVFISHSHDDADFSHRLAANLRARGVEVWVDAWNVAPGADWDMSIDRALYECARYLIVLSPASVDSPEVRGELRIALDENKPIVPVLYRGCLIPRRLRVIQYIDFRERGPDDEAALAEVLRALDVQGAATRAREGRVEQADRIPATPRAPSPAIEEKKLPGVLKPGQPFEPEMVLIPAGEFRMGSDPKVDKGADDDEQPQHRLFLPAYYLARTPVTNAQYETYVRATGQRAPGYWERGRPPRGKEDHPVLNVPWRDAMAYCRWLAQATGKPYNLPSEAEWENRDPVSLDPPGAPCSAASAGAGLQNFTCKGE